MSSQNKADKWTIAGFSSLHSWKQEKALRGLMGSYARLRDYDMLLFSPPLSFASFPATLSLDREWNWSYKSVVLWRRILYIRVYTLWLCLLTDYLTFFYPKLISMLQLEANSISTLTYLRINSKLPSRNLPFTWLQRKRCDLTSPASFLRLPCDSTIHGLSLIVGLSHLNKRQRGKQPTSSHTPTDTRTDTGRKYQELATNHWQAWTRKEAWNCRDLKIPGTIWAESF
jgi:hypothetical protein